jgi:hypothetical protein
VSGSITDARLFDHDPLTGVTEFYYYHPDTDGFTIESRQDVEPLLEQNQRLWNETERSTRYGEWTRIASLPAVIVMQLAEQHILRMDGSILDDKKYRAWLNDSANRLFRTRAGNV